MNSLSQNYFGIRKKIVRLSHLEEDEVVRLYHELVRALELYKEDLLSPSSRREAYHLCKNIDETDAPHVAITIELDGLLWTGDEHLMSGLQKQGFEHFFEP